MADAGRALRMLVVPHFFQLGCLPLEIALLFIFYEIFGMITNLVGGHQGARMGLNHIMNIGLLLQILALGMLAVPAAIVVGLGTGYRPVCPDCSDRRRLFVYSQYKKTGARGPGKYLKT